MERISELNKKCLTNMPVLLDSMKMSMDVLKDVFSSVYDDIDKFLEKQCASTNYTISTNDNIKGNIYLFCDDYKKHHLDNLNLLAKLTYKEVIEYTYRKSYFGFDIEFGYWCDEEQNVIYFQITEESDRLDVLTEKLLNKIQQTIPEAWETILYNNGICIRFTMDTTLSVEKIEECAETFKGCVLKPIINKLQK